MTILYNNPPAYEQKEVPVYANDSTQDLTFTVDYEAEETYTLTLNGADVAAENYTATWADNKITVTLKAAYLTTLAQGAHTFTLKTLAGTVDYSVYRQDRHQRMGQPGNRNDLRRIGRLRDQEQRRLHDGKHGLFDECLLF